MKNSLIVQNHNAAGLKSISAVFALSCILFFSVATAGSNVSKDVKEAALALEAYTVEQKDTAVAKAGEMMGAFDKRIASMEGNLQANYKEMQESTKDKYNKNLQALRKQRNELSEWYGSMKYSSDEAWQDVKNGFAKSYDFLVNAWDNAENEFGKKY